jgi:tetrathionate reductase subunit A
MNVNRFNPLDKKIDRRLFLKLGFGAAAAATACPVLFRMVQGQIPQNVFTGLQPDTPETDPAVNIVYTTCLMCRSDCGIRARVQNGVLNKLDGNPYHPNNVDFDEAIPYFTDPKDARTVIGRCCAKAQAGIEVLYDPFRVKTPLKRVGPRGSGQWKAISWEQALTEIIEGGNLFGEGEVAGLRAIRNLTDDIDPAIPELGKKANQLVFMAGRIEELERDFSDRFFRNCFGTVNFRNDHTSICEQARHLATNVMTGVNHLKPDLVNARYLIIFGSNPLEAGFPMITFARRLVNEFKENGGKLVVVDPRFSPTAAKADRWVPVKPGGDGAIAFGMIRWMIENRRYNADFLRVPSAGAAAAIYGKDRFNKDISTHCDASYLVIADPNNPNNRKFLRASDAGITGGGNEFVVMMAGAPARNTDVKTLAQTLEVQLEFDGMVNGIRVKSVFALLKERVFERTIDEYANIAGIPASTIVQMADEFSSHGTRAVVELYRGPAMHTGGFYNSWALWFLNLLAGNPERIGGWAAGGGGFASTSGALDLMKVPGGVTPGKITISRSGVNYTPAVAPNLIKRDGYPPKRAWFPFASAAASAWQDILPSIDQEYPYPIKALITYYNDCAYTVPGQRETAERVLKDTRKVPLHVSIDIQINETNVFADYILPNVTYLEKWGAPGLAPTIVQKSTPWRQPVVGTYDRGTSKQRDASAPFDPDAPNDYTPYLPQTRLLEDILIDIGKRLGLPGVGANAFDDGSALDRAWDWYKKALDNIVFNARKFGVNVDRLDIVKRGGVFQNPADAYDINSGFLTNRLGRALFNFYNETLATSINANTVTAFDPATLKPLDGEFLEGLPVIQIEPRDIRGKQIKDTDFPFQLVTYKPVFQTQSRTVVCASLRMHMPENFVEINASDAAALRIVTGDLVRVTSASNAAGVLGRARVTEGLRPGVVAIANSYGHWEASSRPYTIDGQETDYDSSRALGVHSNLVMRLDPVLGNVCLQEPISGSAVYFDTTVNVQKVKRRKRS